MHFHNVQLKFCARDSLYLTLPLKYIVIPEFINNLFEILSSGYDNYMLFNITQSILSKIIQDKTHIDIYYNYVDIFIVTLDNWYSYHILETLCKHNKELFIHHSMVEELNSMFFSYNKQYNYSPEIIFCLLEANNPCYLQSTNIQKIVNNVRSMRKLHYMLSNSNLSPSLTDKCINTILINDMELPHYINLD